MPSPTPIAVDAPTAMVPNFSASHEPYSVRLKMSRAATSVPKRYRFHGAGPAHPGG